MTRFTTRSTAGAAAEQLRKTALDAGNKVGLAAGSDGMTILTHYLDWAHQAELLLGNHFDYVQVAELVHTSHHAHLRTCHGAEPRIIQQVLDELTRRQKALDVLAGRLEALDERWRVRAGVYPIVVPDTNMFLDEDNRIETVNWAAAVNAAGARVVVPVVVLHELDRHKYLRNTRSLARQSAKWLRQHLPPDHDRRAPHPTAAATTTLECLAHDGPMAPDGDAVLIEVTAWLTSMADVPVRLVTRDLNMRTRAQAAGVVPIQLDGDAPTHTP